MMLKRSRFLLIPLSRNALAQPILHTMLHQKQPTA